MAIKHQGEASGFAKLAIRLLYVLDIYQGRKQFDLPDKNILFAMDRDSPYFLLLQMLMLYWLDKTASLESQYEKPSTISKRIVGWRSRTIISGMRGGFKSA
ncbi:MAG: hypothetical protein R3C11_30025 [Planctomycetaceae bacterium]